MDTSLIVVSALVVIGVFAPIYFIIRSGNSDKNNLLKQLKAVAEKNNFSIDESEVWADKAIAADKKQGKLFFLSKNGDDHTVQILSFSEIEKCEGKLIFQNSKNGAVKEAVLEEAYLQLIFKPNAPKKEQKLCFYEESSDFMPNFEKERLEKWRKIITAA